MVFSLGVWAIDGQTNDAALARLQLQAATSGGEGVVGAGDLVVSATATPGSSVVVGGGACIVAGKEAAFQGSYFGYNVGGETLPITATGSGGGRSDLIVARVEDPTVAGTPWTHDPATDSLIYARVIEGVDPATTKAPADQSAIALARIDIPSSTSTITQAMIHDLRDADDNTSDGNGRAQRALRIQRGVDPVDLAGNIIYPNWENWPDLVWTVVVPSWATQAQILAHWGSALFDITDGNGDAVGNVRVRLWTGTTNVWTNYSKYNFNKATSAYRVDILNADQVPIPAALRGRTCSLAMEASGAGNAGRLRADDYTNFYVDIEWLEIPVPNIDD